MQPQWREIRIWGVFCKHFKEKRKKYLGFIHVDQMYFHIYRSKSHSFLDSMIWKFVQTQQVWHNPLVSWEVLFNCQFLLSIPPFIFGLNLSPRPIGVRADPQQQILNVTLQVSVFLQQWRKWSKNDGVFVLWHSVSPRPHQGWASQTSSVNLGLLPSVSLSAARLGGGRWALAENDPSGLIVFWPTDWHWEEKQRHGKRARNREGGRERAKEWWLSANAPSSN